MRRLIPWRLERKCVAWEGRGQGECVCVECEFHLNGTFVLVGRSPWKISPIGRGHYCVQFALEGNPKIFLLSIIWIIWVEIKGF